MYEQWVYNISVLFEGVAKYENKKKEKWITFTKIFEM